MPVTDYLNLISSAITWSDVNSVKSSSPSPSPSSTSTLTSSVASSTSSSASPLLSSTASSIITFTPSLSSLITANSHTSLYLLNYHNESIIAINGSSSSPGSSLPSPSGSPSTGNSTGSPTSSYLSPSSLSTHSPISTSFLPGLYNDTESALFFNINTNGTLYDSHDEASYRSLLFTLLTSLTLGALILSTVIGNLFVMVAIWIDRNLQNIQNYLVASLAAADFMVACLVMPLGALYEVQGEWSLGSLLCDIWTSADVLCCTASILHLVAIALDRYWAVNSVTYMHSRSPTKICSIILSVWSVALIVSIGPILGWKDPDYERRVTIEKRCLISQHMGYQIFATISTFYGPLMVILFLYWRIYKIARRRVKNRPGNKSVVHVKADESLRSTSNGKPLALVETEYRSTGGNNLPIKPLIIEESRYSRSDEKETSSLERGVGAISEVGVVIGGDNSDSSFNMAQVPSCDKKGTSTVLGIDKALRLRSKKDSSNSKREGKTAKILAIITGIFIVCWLPFFVHALVTALCGEACEAAPPLYSIFLWLGYANSLLNPVIYTIFSRDFRNAFRRILFGANPNRM